MLKYNTTIMTTPSGKWLLPVQPVDLPDYTLRIKCLPGTSPQSTHQGETITLVDAINNIWDIYYPYNDWSNMVSFTTRTNIEGVISGNLKYVTDVTNLLNNAKNVKWIRSLDVSGAENLTLLCNECYALKLIADLRTDSATNMDSMFDACTSLVYAPQLNTSNVTNTYQMFNDCTSLKYIPTYDLSNVTNMRRMFSHCESVEQFPLFDLSNVSIMEEAFQHCYSLTQVPLFDTSSATDTDLMFSECINVESGALALYQQASTQENPPSSHTNMFIRCGMNTVSGMAELNQIPYTWGGELK